jgi:hypothetical protein
MSKAHRRSRKTPATAAGELTANDEGRWGLDLWSGNASFSEWFYQRLQWKAEIERRRLDDLRPALPDGAFESLLLAIRDHLERRTPLDLRLRARLPDGRIESWHVQGLAEHNAGGHPVHLSGSMRA